MTNSPGFSETELELSFGEYRAVVCDYGASLRRLFLRDPNRKETDLVWGYSGKAQKKGGQGDVLFPFPGRIRNGKYRFEGKEYQLQLNDKDGPNAIHGFVRTQPWKVVEQSPNSVTYQITLNQTGELIPGYPFKTQIRVTYELSQNGLRCEFDISNLDLISAPVGVGFHPYFTVGTSAIDEAWIEMPATHCVEFGKDLLPTGKIVSVMDTPWDFRKPRAIGHSVFNHCYTQLIRGGDGLSRFALMRSDQSRRIEVWMDDAFPYVVVYTGDTIPAPNGRRAFAIEPMSCATDAFNQPSWGLKSLEPGKSFSGSWGVRLAL